MASDKMLGSFDQKSAPEDNDLLVEYDASASKVKNVKFGGVWNWIVKKLTSAVINELQTSSKNVVGAINELNSKRKRECVFTNSVRFPLDIYQSAILMGTVNSSDANLFLITRTYTNAITIKVITGTSNHGITGEFDKTTSLTTLKFIGNNSAVILY